MQARKDATGVRYWASWPRWWRLQCSSAPSPQAPRKMRLASGTDYYTKLRLAWMRLASCIGPFGRDGGESCTLPLGRCGSEGNAARTACAGLYGQGGEATMKQAPAHVTATCAGPRGREDGKTVRGKAASRGITDGDWERALCRLAVLGNKMMRTQLALWDPAGLNHGSTAQQRTGLHGRGGGEDAAASTITRDSNLHWASWP